MILEITEKGQSFVGAIADRVASEHYGEHEKIWGLNVTEKGSCKELDQSERDVVKTGFDHVAMILTDFESGFE